MNNGGIEGDPTEVALITAAAKAGLSREVLEQHLPRIDTLPFESQHQYMATLHAAGKESAAVIYLKGSVESVLSRCRDVYSAGTGAGLLDPASIHREVEEMAARGLRVLAFARKVVTATGQSVSHADVADGLSFLGLQAMMDPPRQEAIAAVRACRGAGLQVKMITGDHVATAAAIAVRLRGFGLGHYSSIPAK